MEMTGLFVLGAALIAAVNAWKWCADRALAVRIASRTEPVPALNDYPLVSVLVAAWNEAPVIARHIEAFQKLRYPERELILCAGGSDDTYQLASRSQPAGICVLEQRPGEGKQRALGRCLERAGGELIFLTDADCLLDDESFERTLAPLINEAAAASTGASHPLDEQRRRPFILHRWFTDVYDQAHRGATTEGILGRNAALQRAALEAVGGFQARVHTGTDYHMAKLLRQQGYPIRYARSSVATAFASTLRAYWKQQSRWLRNVVTHGLKFRAYREVAACLLPSLVGVVMLFGALPALLLGRVFLMLWGWLWLYALFSRARYMRFGEIVTGNRFSYGYALLPIYMAIDFAIWASILLQYPFRRGRVQW